MYIPRLYAESRSLKRTRQPRLTEPGERMKRVFFWISPPIIREVRTD